MAKNSSALNDLQAYIRSLNLPHDAKIHVNGKDHPSAVVVVDFGYPTPPVRLNSDQSQDLAGKMRKFTRELINKDVNIRVSSDNYLGVVYWASIQ